METIAAARKAAARKAFKSYYVVWKPCSLGRCDG